MSKSKNGQNIKKMNLLCFSTDTNNIKPLEILKSFVCKTNNVSNYIEKDNVLKFYFSISSCKYLSVVLDLSVVDKNIYNFIDSYILFVNLEIIDSINSLKSITDYFVDYCLIDKRVYVLGSFFDMKKEKNVVDEKEIIDILEEKKIKLVM